MPWLKVCHSLCSASHPVRGWMQTPGPGLIRSSRAHACYFLARVHRVVALRVTLCFPHTLVTVPYAFTVGPLIEVGLVGP